MCVYDCDFSGAANVEWLSEEEVDVEGIESDMINGRWLSRCD